MNYRVVFSPEAQEQLAALYLIGVFYGGQDYGTLLHEGEWDE